MAGPERSRLNVLGIAETERRTVSLVPEHAAEAKTNHGLPQFITVIDSCNTVASETHTKYGIWARLTHL